MVDLTSEESEHWREHYSDNAKYWEKWAEPMAEHVAGEEPATGPHPGKKVLGRRPSGAPNSMG